MSTERVSGSLAASQQGTPIDGPGEAGWPSAEQLLADLPAHLDEDALEFLRAEYEHLSNSFISNEASGETRVNVFLGLVGAGSAGLGFAADALKDQPDMLLRLVVVVASTLLLFGLGTLRRVMQRLMEPDSPGSRTVSQ